VNDRDIAADHRTDPPPESIRPGISYKLKGGGEYVTEGSAWDVADHDWVVLFRALGPYGLGGPAGVSYALPIGVFRMRFTRLPDQEPDNG
jgi:hypothetical protein